MIASEKPSFATPRAWFRAAALIAAASAPVCAAAASRAPAPAAVATPGPAFAGSGPPPRPVFTTHRGARTSAATVTSYAFVDVGAPHGYALSYAFAMNDQDQIVGEALQQSSPSMYTHCLAFTGSAWVDPQPSPASFTCALYHISDEDATTHTFLAGGYTFVDTSLYGDAVVATVSAHGAATRVFSAHNFSSVDAMNVRGAAFGTSFYGPYGPFISQGPPFVVAGNSMTVLQPQCTTGVPGCIVYITPSGRSINAGGTLLGNAYDSSKGQYIEYTATPAPSFVQFDLAPVIANFFASGPSGMDDAGRVVYSSFDQNGTTYVSFVFDPKTSTTTNLGSSGDPCGVYVPIAINGPGRVVGYRSSCTPSSDQGYWTWDAVNGVQDVNAGVTLPAGITGLVVDSINDRGDLLVEFDNPATHLHDWGYLKAGATANVARGVRP